jgi:hypothetical protein
MYPSNNDIRDNTDVDNNSQIRHTNISPTTSNFSQSPSPSCPTLLVIDDTSNSEDSTTNNCINNIPTKSMPSTNAQISHIQIPTAIGPSTLDLVNGSVDQQRRRNSSIAKLLGGHPLHNQQYEEIHQQILDDQSAQNISNNNDNGIDSGIQRTRSSITRTLLMNAERTNSMTKLPHKIPATNPPGYSKDFEYLIRQEVDKFDTEHSPSTLQRNNSTPKIFQNLNSSSNTNAQSPPIQTQLKRKRPILKTRLTTPNKSGPNVPPFSLHEPFELDSSAQNPIPSVHHPQKDLLRFDPIKRPRHTNPQQYNLPVNNTINNPTPNQSSYPYHKINMQSTHYNQFNIHQDHVPSNNCSSSCNCAHYSHSTKLVLPSPVTHLSSATNIPHNNNNNNSTTMTTARKAKSMLIRPEPYELPRQRSYSSTATQSNSSLTTSSEPNVPLKKRLLHAYNNEQPPASSL